MFIGNQSREKLREWLAPPNPSINHNTARGTQHGGTAKWFLQGNTFDEWKENGSLLWIRGNRTLLSLYHPFMTANGFSGFKPGREKVFFGTCFHNYHGRNLKLILLLSSAIIENVKQMRESRSVLVAYYYFDFKDAAKRDVQGLLTSLVLQLVDNSDRCWDLLSQLYVTCCDGSEQPSEAALSQCLKSMLDLLGQFPTYIIIDALDECPNNPGTPSAREKVLDFVEDLVKSNRFNLFVCITSRPEQDINAALNPLIPPSRRISLHEEGGQREDINSYVRFFVQNDRAMRRWRTEDKELVIRVLSERAQGM